ncbi:energy transducer TonB [Brevundimonas diminuta]|uniref:energy transducer TonB n=1 Tax=Brevundimonas diminuta TaxID=293 RepID=UPI003D05E248
MTMALDQRAALTSTPAPHGRASGQAMRRKTLATTAALILHAAPLLLLLRPMTLPAPPVEYDAMTVELIRMDAAPPRPPSERTPGKEQVRSAQSQTRPPDIVRRVAIAEAAESLPAPTPLPVQVAAPSPQPPAPATTAPPAQVAPAAAQASSAPREWRARLLAHLDQNKRYPAIAERQRQEGVVHIRFTMDRAGRVLSSSITRGSGRPMLDREALAMLQRAQPLPLPPADEPGEVIEIATHVDFFTRR